MCYHRSFIVTEDHKVYSHPTSDHHTAIRTEHKIREEGLHATIPHAAVEINPVYDLFDIRGWSFTLDERTPPSWWKKTHQEVAMEKLISEFKRVAFLDSTVYKTDRSLEVPYLRNIKPGSVLITEGHLLIANCESLRHVRVMADVITIKGGAVREFANNRLMCNEFCCENPALAHFALRSKQVVAGKVSDRRRDDFYSQTFPYQQHIAQAFSMKNGLLP